MGRKPKNSKNAQKSQKLEVVNPIEVDPAIKSSSLVTFTEKPGNSIPTEEAKEANHSKGYARKTVKKAPNAIRRSGRFRKAVMATESHCIEQTIEEMIISDSEKEDEPTNVEFPEPAMDGREFHEKIDYIVELLRAQKRATNELNRNGKNLFGECSGAAEVTYKSLYFDSQKKIEALMEENNQLSKKLEYANGKIEIYEKEDHVSYGMLEKVKDVFFSANGSRAMEPVEAAVNGSTIAAEGAVECKYSRRKRGPN